MLGSTTDGVKSITKDVFSGRYKRKNEPYLSVESQLSSIGWNACDGNNLGELNVERCPKFASILQRKVSESFER